jgi:tetratricopeptide (TPR) repeat protein
LRAHQCYDHAIELDPRSAEALGWSGWQHIMDAVMSWSNDATTSLRLAYAAARAAIANDPHNEMGHWALAEALILDGDFERGYRAYDRAMEINPSNPDLLATRGIHEAISGRLDLGIGMIQQAIERNGLRPDWYFWNLGIAFFVANRLNEAITALECMRAHNTDSLAYLVACLAHGGRLDDARKRLAEWYHLEADFNLDALAEAHAYLGEAACKSFLDGLQLVLQSAQPQLHSVLR